MILAGFYGRYPDDIDDDHFPIQGDGRQKKEVILVNRARLSLSPAKIEHLLSFGVTYPEVQREFPIIALGSFFDISNGFRVCPCLRYIDGQRRLCLVSFSTSGGSWDKRCRFISLHT
jgi:hypothetical protein